MTDHADIVREALIHGPPYAESDDMTALAALDALIAERDEYKMAAEAEAFAADEFRARLMAAKTAMPDWTAAGWDAFIDAALKDKKLDPDIKAMQAINRALAELPSDAHRRRVMEWTVARGLGKSWISLPRFRWISGDGEEKP
jgi:hypothetical protein